MSHPHDLAAELPEFTDDPAARLAHTLAAYTAVYSNRSDNDWALIATNGLIPGHDTTGITWGDLRALLDQIQTRSE